MYNFEESFHNQCIIELLIAHSKASFTCTLNKTVFVSEIIDLFDVTCKQHHMSALNPFLNGTKTVMLTVCVNRPLLEHVIIMRSCFNTDFASQIKLTKLLLIHCTIVIIPLKTDIISRSQSLHILDCESSED